MSETPLRQRRTSNRVAPATPTGSTFATPPATQQSIFTPSASRDENVVSRKGHRAAAPLASPAPAPDKQPPAAPKPPPGSPLIQPFRRTSPRRRSPAAHQPLPSLVPPSSVAPPSPVPPAPQEAALQPLLPPAPDDVFVPVALPPAAHAVVVVVTPASPLQLAFETPVLPLFAKLLLIPLALYVVSCSVELLLAPPPNKTLAQLDFASVLASRASGGAASGAAGSGNVFSWGHEARGYGTPESQPDDEGVAGAPTGGAAQMPRVQGAPPSVRGLNAGWARIGDCHSSLLPAPGSAEAAVASRRAGELLSPGGALVGLRSYDTQDHVAGIAGVINELAIEADGRAVVCELAAQLGLHFDSEALSLVDRWVGTSLVVCPAGSPAVHEWTFRLMDLVDSRFTEGWAAANALHAGEGVRKDADFEAAAHGIIPWDLSAAIRAMREADVARARAGQPLIAPAAGPAPPPIPDAILNHELGDWDGLRDYLKADRCRGGLFNSHDLGDVGVALSRGYFDGPVLIGAASFPVGGMGLVVSRNAGKSGWWSGPAKSMQFDFAIIADLRKRGYTVLAVDLTFRSFAADAFDYPPFPPGVAAEFKASSAALVRFSPAVLISLGAHAAPAIDAAATALYGRPAVVEGAARSWQYGNGGSRVVHFQHPTVFSFFVSGNAGVYSSSRYHEAALSAGGFLGTGGVKLWGLALVISGEAADAYLPNGVGGELGLSIRARSLEKISHQLAATVAPCVLKYLAPLGVTTDIEAAAYVQLHRDKYGHLEPPLGRNVLFLSVTGSVGGEARAGDRMGSHLAVKACASRTQAQLHSTSS